MKTKTKAKMLQNWQSGIFRFHPYFTRKASKHRADGSLIQLVRLYPIVHPTCQKVDSKNKSLHKVQKESM
jgi:hypothetical protein